MARSFTRRDFLSGSLGVGAAGALHATLGPLGPAGSGPPPARTLRFGRRRRPRAKPPSRRRRKVDRTLVLCTLFGGNDGLNTVIPYESSAYHQLRGRIAIPPVTRCIRSDRSTASSSDCTRRCPASNPSGTPGQVAIILGSGLPGPESKPLPVDGDHADRRSVGRQPQRLARALAGRDRIGPDARPVGGPEVPQVFAGVPPAGIHARGQHRARAPNNSGATRTSTIRTASSSIPSNVSAPSRRRSPSRARTCSSSAPRPPPP